MTTDFDAPMQVVLPDASAEGSLIIDVDGYEGPLDVLLALARAQKVDLRKISILALAEQYLDFVAEARRCISISRPIIWSWRPGSRS